MIRYDVGSRTFIPELLCANGIEAAFGSRYSSFPRIITARQVHGTMIADVARTDIDPGEADALYTSETGVGIGVRTADCVPLLYADMKRRVVAASHQGWNGTLDGMVQSVVKRFVEAGSDPADLLVAIGPSVGACCYRMYGERKATFENQYPEYMKSCMLRGADMSYLDLARLNYLQLIALGVRPDRIDRGVFCTVCDSERFFSYQREGTGCGHMISYILMKENIS